MRRQLGALVLGGVLAVTFAAPVTASSFTYSSKHSLRRQQKAFVTASFDRLPFDIRILTKSLDFEVVFRAWNGRTNVCIYHHGEKRVYLPRAFWKDQLLLAKWMRLENKAVFVHELFHVVDMQYLLNPNREWLLNIFTGFAHSGEYINYYGVTVPVEWVPRDWAQSPAELFADTGVEAFTDLPPHDRADGALKVTPEGIAAVKQVLGEGDA